MKKRSNEATPEYSIPVKVPKSLLGSRELKRRLADAVETETERLIESHIKRVAKATARLVANEQLEKIRPRLEAAIREAVAARIDRTVKQAMRDLYIEIHL